MNERKLSDLINYDNTDKEKMIEETKEKLRWYTFEASEEEFDPEAVDILVKFLQKAEPEMGKAPIREKEDVKFAEGEQAAKRNNSIWQGKRVDLGEKKIAVAIICIGVLVVFVSFIGKTLGTSSAWEDGEFFRWVRRDKEGKTIITSPEDLGMDLGIMELYYEITEVPEEYQKYLINPNDNESLEGAEVELILIHKASAFQEIGEELLLRDEKKIECGVTIFEKEIRVVRDSYDEFQYQYSIRKGKYTFDVYIKESANEKIEYMVCMYESNKKFFVSGELEIDELVLVLESYVYNVL